MKIYFTMKSYSSIETNAPFHVATLFPCQENVSSEQYLHNTLWRQTLLGCQIILLMQELHGFKIDYVYQKQDINRDVTTEIQMYYDNASRVDIFARPMSLRSDVLLLANPVGAIFDWNFGFTIAYPDTTYMNFYSKPFTRQLWSFLYAMAIFSSLLFYLLKRFENTIQRGRWEIYWYELLTVLGAYCQHIPPIEASTLSRRTAYFVFFIFSYVVYTYYTSNLLSHLVNDSKHAVSLQELLDSDVECVVLASVKAIVNNNIASIYRGDDMTTSYQKLLSLRPVGLEEGLSGVKATKTALLADYVSIEPYIRKVFNSNEICTLAQIDVVVNLKKYFFVSKTFPFAELAKISLLRIKESGITARIVSIYFSEENAVCTPPPHVVTNLLQIAWPLTLLLAAYLGSLCVLMLEIWHFNRNKVLPFVN